METPINIVKTYYPNSDEFMLHTKTKDFAIAIFGQNNESASKEDFKLAMKSALIMKTLLNIDNILDSNTFENDGLTGELCDMNEDMKYIDGLEID